MSTASATETRNRAFYKVVRLPATVKTGIELLFSTHDEPDATYYASAYNRRAVELGKPQRAVIV